MLKAVIGSALALVVLTACQPEPNRNSRKFGRNAFGSPNQTPRLSSTQATAVVNSGGDAQMTSVASVFAAPALSANPEWALGNVNARTGVKMWAETYVIGTDAGSSVDPSRSRIHIEVADSRVGQNDGAGGQLAPFTMHVGYDQSGFEGAEGGISSGGVALRFDQSGYGSILVVGQISGSTFSGEVSFVNTMTSGQQVSLGSFTMQTCAFFICQ